MPRAATPREENTEVEVLGDYPDNFRPFVAKYIGSDPEDTTRVVLEFEHNGYTGVTGYIARTAFAHGEDQAFLNDSYETYSIDQAALTEMLIATPHNKMPSPE
jgi:hypothetical protein